MITLTASEQTDAIIILGTILIAALFVGASVLWRQGQDLTDHAADLDQLDDDVDVVWRWSSLRSRQGLLLWVLSDLVPATQVAEEPAAAPRRPTPHPRPLPDEPPTIVAHPSSTSARKQALLQPGGHGEHRARDGGKTVAEILAELG